MAFEMENPALASGASGIAVHATKLNGPEDKRLAQTRQVLRAELRGSTWCSIGDVVATGNTPVLALCRQLLAAGVDPDQALEVFRNGTLALRVRSIGDAARLTVKTGGNGAPIFAEEYPAEGAGGPLARKSENFDPAAMEGAQS